MKKAYLYILALLMTGSWLASCEETEPPFYADHSNGVYFDYDTPEALSDTINFADYIGMEGNEIPITIRLRLLGYVADHDRKLVFKAMPVENFPQAEVILPEVVFKAGEYEKEIEIKAVRPGETDIRYATTVCVDESLSEIASGAEEFSRFTFYVEESYTVPDRWDYGPGYFFGTFTPDKHRFIVEVTGDAQYFTKDPWSGTLAQYNLEVVDSIRTHNQKYPDNKIPFGIPFYYEVKGYSKPHYWNEQHDKYLGTYSEAVFVSICNANNVTTLNEEEFFSGDEAKMKQLNKQAVLAAMQEYNNKLWWGMTGADLKASMYVPMFKGVDYDVIKPEWWQPYNAGPQLDGYYGEYSDAKYQFMIKTWLEVKGEQDFFLLQLFPLTVDNSTGSFVWDNTVGGEAGIKECYKAIKAEYDKNPGAYEFTFPELDIK